MKSKFNSLFVLILVTIAWLLTANFNAIYMKIMGAIIGIAWIILLIVTLYKRKDD